MPGQRAPRSPLAERVRRLLDDGPARFGVALAGIVLVGIAIRVVYVQVVAAHSVPFQDSLWYFDQAANIRRGVGYVDIGRQYGASNGHRFAAGLRPTAFWPPGYPTFLAGVQRVFGDSFHTSRIAGAATGGATIAFTGLLGRQIAGRAVGLLAALLAAASPLLIAVDGSAMSETLYVPLVLLALLLAQRARATRTALSWCALGATIGIATLVRQDALLLVVLAVIAAAVLAHDRLSHLLPRVGLGLGVTALVITPWLARNAVAIGQPVISTGSASSAIAGANCAQTYRGDQLGSWAGACADFSLGYHLSEARFSNKMRDDGISYALAHASRWPTVATARVARVWGLWNPVDQASREKAESRVARWQELMWPVSLAMLVFGLVGLRVLARRGRPIAMLVAPVAMTTTTALLTYGNTRFRAPAECALAIGAAAAILALARRLGPAVTMRKT